MRLIQTLSGFSVSKKFKHWIAKVQSYNNNNNNNNTKIEELSLPKVKYKYT